MRAYFRYCSPLSPKKGSFALPPTSPDVRFSVLLLLAAGRPWIHFWGGEPSAGARWGLPAGGGRRRSCATLVVPRPRGEGVGEGGGGGAAAEAPSLLHQRVGVAAAPAARAGIMCAEDMKCVDAATLPPMEWGMGVVPARCSTTARCAACQEDFPFPLPCIFGVRSFCRPCHNTAVPARVAARGSSSHWLCGQDCPGRARRRGGRGG